MRIRGSRRIRSGGAAAAIAVAATVLALGAATASAVPLHALSPEGCIADVGDIAGCGAATQGLDSARGVAVSPDGKSVYAVANGDRAIVTFHRAPDGALSDPSCIEDVGGGAGCGAGNTAPGLGGAFAVTVSPDGENVYVASSSDDAIVTFDRAPDGTLSDPSCIEDVGGAAGCGPGNTAQGLDSVRAVTISPDGASVYALGNFDDAVVRFDRGPNGSLSNPSCVADPPDLAGCGATTEGLDAARGAAVSPDGSGLYVVSDVDDAIVTFDRAPSGALSNPSCVGDVGGPADCGPGNTTDGLNGAKGMAISPDGANVYVSSITDNAIVTFDRAADGALSNPRCIEDVGGTAGCGPGNTTQGLEDARAVAVSPGGSSLYSVAGDDKAIVSFDRGPGGALSSPSCIQDVPEPPATAACGSTAEGLNDVQDLAISPDGGSVYTTSSFDDAIASFARELTPGGEGQAPTAPEGAAVRQRPPGSDARLTCKPKRRKVRCILAFAAVADVSKVRISRRGLTYASGRPVSGPNAILILRFRRSKPLPRGRYVLTVIQGAGATRVVTKTRLRVR
jgi:DNA-binding beta-propeller fold protein YncE